MTSTLGRITFAIGLTLGSHLAGADTLQDIYELAMKNDASLKAAEATYRANLETEKLARSALLPQVQGSVSYSFNDTETTRGANPLSNTPAYDATVETDTTSFGISLAQNLFDLPSWFSFRAGQKTSEQAKAQFAADQQQLIIRVAESYFNVLRAQENLEATRAEEKAVKRQLEQTQQRFDVGLIPITDVHEARAVYDSTVARRLSDEASMGTALEALTVLTGQGHANIWLLSKDFPVADPTPANRQQWVDFALKNNYELKAALYGMQAAHRTARAKKAEHLPSLSASLSYTDTENESDTDLGVTRFSNDDTSESGAFSIDLAVPLFSGGGVSASRRQAYEQYNAALQKRILTERQVIQQTRSLHLNVSTDVQRVKARKQGIVSAQSALDATQAGYEVGTRNIVDVLQSRRSQYAAIRDYANARFDYVINMLKLKRQAGILSPKDIYDLNKWLQAPAPPRASTSS